MLVRTEKNKDRETSAEFGYMEFTGKCGKSSLGRTVAYGWAGVEEYTRGGRGRRKCEIMTGSQEMGRRVCNEGFSTWECQKVS